MKYILAFVLIVLCYTLIICMNLYDRNRRLERALARSRGTHTSRASRPSHRPQASLRAVRTTG